MENMPNFKNENEESEFWENHDSVEYIDWSNAKPVSFSNLKPTSKNVSLRLPENILAHLKQEANKLDVPYHSLIKIFINEGLRRIQVKNKEVA